MFVQMNLCIMILQSIVVPDSHYSLTPIPKIPSKNKIFRKYRMFEMDQHENSKYFKFCLQREKAYGRETSRIIGRYLTLSVPEISRRVKSKYEQLLECAKKNENHLQPQPKMIKQNTQQKSVVYKKVRHILPEEISRVGNIVEVIKKNNYEPTFDPSFFVRI